MNNFRWMQNRRTFRGSGTQLQYMWLVPSAVKTPDVQDYSAWPVLHSFPNAWHFKTCGNPIHLTSFTWLMLPGLPPTLPLPRITVSTNQRQVGLGTRLGVVQLSLVQKEMNTSRVLLQEVMRPQCASRFSLESVTICDHVTYNWMN